MSDTIDECRRAAEALVRQDAQAQLAAWLSDEQDVPPVQLPREGVDPFAAGAVARFRQELSKSPADGSSRVNLLLYRGLVAGALDRTVRPALAAAAGSAVAHVSYVSGDPGAPPWRGDAALRETEDTEQREALFGELLGAWAGSAPAYLEALRVMHQAAGQLGIVDPDDLLRTLARVEPSALRSAAVRLLEATEPLQRRALRQACETHQLPLHPAHLPRLFGLPEMEHRFTAERMLSVAGSLLEGMGLPVVQEQGLQLQEDPQPGPRPSRAFPVNLPREVRLVIHRAPGLRWAQHHLLALGQALHWLHTEPGPFPFRWPFGHRAVSDGFGLLLASLLTHPAVLRERGLPLPVAEALARLAQRARLIHLRTLAALLARSPCGPEIADDPFGAYAEAIGWARAFPVSEEEARAWPLRVEAIYAAETLQSWLLAASFRQALLRQLGDGWWRSPAAAEPWLETVKPGQRLSVTELCASLAHRTPSGLVQPPAQLPATLPLDPAPLIDWLHQEG